MNTKSLFFFIPFLLSSYIWAEEKGSLSLENGFWNDTQTHFLFAPGILNAEYIVGKYCPYYHASTGEDIISNGRFHAVNGYTAHSCNFAEISLRNTPENLVSYYDRAVYRLCKSSLYYKFFVERRTLAPYGITIQGIPQGQESLRSYFIDISKINLGQHADIAILSQEYDKFCADTSADTPMVLYGTSRGAATSFNFIATEYGKKRDKRIKAIVLEGCFDTVAAVAPSKMLLKLLPGFSTQAIAPIQDSTLQSFVKVCTQESIPVLFVTSRKDEIVPYKNTMRLCHSLKEKGLTDLYVLQLKNSGHRFYTTADPEDFQRYLSVVHAFYKRYGLSHNPAYAAAGDEILTCCLFA